MASKEPGVFSNAVPNDTPALVIVTIVFLIITTGFFVFRQAWRWKHHQRGLDDAMAACAYIILLLQSIFGGIAAHYGFGKHMKDILPTYSKALEFFFMYQICYKLLGGFTKLTFCFLYLRIFSQKGFQRLVIAVAVIVAAGSLAFALGTVLQCSPVHRAWNHKVPGTCISNTAFWYSHAAFNTFWDIVIYIMPIPLIRTLKLARGQKTGLISIFCLGAFVIAASIVRMVMLRSSAGSTDPTWGSTMALIWTEVEANTSVICCCLPALRVPLLNLWHRIRGGPSSNPPTVNRAVKEPYDSAWSGPNQSEAAASHGKQPRGLQPLDGSQGKSLASNSTGLKMGDTWYDRVLGNLTTDKHEEPSRSSSQDELARIEAGLPPQLNMGGIYKTTELVVHEDAQSLRRESEPEHAKQMTLQDMLRN